MFGTKKNAVDGCGATTSSKV